MFLRHALALASSLLLLSFARICVRPDPRLGSRRIPVPDPACRPRVRAPQTPLHVRLPRSGEQRTTTNPERMRGMPVEHQVVGRIERLAVVAVGHEHDDPSRAGVAGEQAPAPVEVQLVERHEVVEGNHLTVRAEARDALVAAYVQTFGGAPRRSRDSALGEPLLRALERLEDPAVRNVASDERRDAESHALDRRMWHARDASRPHGGARASRVFGVDCMQAVWQRTSSDERQCAREMRIRLPVPEPMLESAPDRRSGRGRGMGFHSMMSGSTPRSTMAGCEAC